jgi:hypothetical protein
MGIILGVQLLVSTLSMWLGLVWTEQLPLSIDPNLTSTW